jgi:2-oxoacid:acceptor oxidoreductase delta subunit (pyruvate/2-ketoisovalerate family)
VISADDHGGARIHAGGDMTGGPRTMIHAVAAGKRAVIAMDCRRQGIDPGPVFEKISIGQGPALSFSDYAGWPPLKKVRRNIKKIVTSEKIVYDYFQKSPPPEKVLTDPDERHTTFEPFDPPLGDDSAVYSAARCFHCGRCIECDNCLIFCPEVSVLVRGTGESGYDIDYDYCKGCGICNTECPRQAMTMVDEETPVHEEA